MITADQAAAVWWALSDSRPDHFTVRQDGTCFVATVTYDGGETAGRRVSDRLPKTLH